MEELLTTCGYVASFIGTFIEGELLLLTTVLASKMGHFNFFGAMAAAFAGAYTRDWLTFIFAKKKGKRFIERKPKLKTKLSKVNNWLEKYPNAILSSYRMIYGMGMVTVLMAGVSGVSAKKFAILSAISCAVWISVYGGLGYFCAEVMVQNIEWMSSHSGYVIGGLALVGLLYWFFVKRKELKYEG